MGGIIRQFVDTPTRPGGAAAGGTSSEFDAIVGAYAAQAVRTDHAPRPAAPIAIGMVRRRRRGPALLTIGALAVAGVALSGASIVSADAIVRGPLTASQAVLATQKERATTVATTPSTPFGSAAGIGDQLAVSISDPIAYSPAPGATGASPGVDIVSTVTVTNVSSGPVDPRLRFDVEGTTATRIFDKKQGIRLNSVTSLAEGQSISYRIAWAADAVPKFALNVTSVDSGDSAVIGP